MVFSVTRPPDTPGIEKDELRFDVCIEASEEIRGKEASLIATKGEISGGKFAVFLDKGPLERLGDSYHYLYSKWIFETDITLRDVRQFIKYINPFADIADIEKETEIYFPVN